MSEHISRGGSFTRSRPTHYYTISCLYRPYVRSVMAKLKLRLDGFLAAPHTREKKWKKEKTRPITLWRQFQSFAHTSSSPPPQKKIFWIGFCFFFTKRLKISTRRVGLSREIPHETIKKNLKKKGKKKEKSRERTLTVRFGLRRACRQRRCFFLCWHSLLSLLYS